MKASSGIGLGNKEDMMFLRRSFSIFVFGPVLIGGSLAGCQPTVKIEAPDKPIEINLNVKIEQEIRVKVDRDLDDLLASNPELF
jgi:YnbE-like lipoprotein